MSELLQFMYQGEVNVKHAELQQFMKIAETLQIKGLTTNTASGKGSHGYMQNNHGMNAGNGHRGQHGNNNSSENHHGSSMNSSAGEMKGNFSNSSLCRKNNIYKLFFHSHKTPRPNPIHQPKTANRPRSDHKLLLPEAAEAN